MTADHKTTPAELYRPRLCRVINVFGVVICTVAGIRSILAADFALAGLMLLFTVLNGCAIAANTRAIHRKRALAARPDYALIAAMEREVWGQAFEHLGAPAPERGPQLLPVTGGTISASCDCGGYYELRG